MVYISGGTSLLETTDIFSHFQIKEGMHIADLGCGATGYFTIAAAHLVGNSGLVYAVDVLKSVLEEVSKKARLEGIKNVKTIWSNLEIPGATNIPKNSIDVCMLVNILFQTKERGNIIAETARLMKKNAKLLVIDWKQTHIPFGPPPIDRVEPQEIKKLAKNADLGFVDEFSAGNFHYALVFQK